MSFMVTETMFSTTVFIFCCGILRFRYPHCVSRLRRMDRLRGGGRLHPLNTIHQLVNASDSRMLVFPSRGSGGVVPGENE